VIHNNAGDHTVSDEKLGIVWGARDIGAVIGLTARQASYLLEKGAIRAARKVTAERGSRWCASITGLREQFVHEPQKAETEAEHETA
jgi:hypothetical protein